MPVHRHTTRRAFLRTTTAAMLAPMIVPSRVLGREGAVAPSDKITIAFIGMGKMNNGHLGAFLGDDRVQVIGLCDVDAIRLRFQVRRAEAQYASKNGLANFDGVAAYGDYRELCARDDLDGVVIATPNHWHAICAVEAARRGKDIYLEKPLARTIGEGQAIVSAVRRYGRVLQVGSQQRSDSTFRFGAELVRNGHVGKVHTVHVNVGDPPKDDDLPNQPTPEGLDWDFWLGPAPDRGYNEILAPAHTVEGFPLWRDYRDYAGGGMTDFGAHHYDIAQWGLGMDGSGPVEVHPPGYDDYPKITYVYANGIKMRHQGGVGGSGIQWIGDRGWVAVNRGQYLRSEPDGIRHEILGADLTRLYKSDNHKYNWLDCVRSRRDPICTAEIGHSTATVCHIGNICYQLDRSLKWDPEAERFVDDEMANRLIHRSFRSPWRLEV